MIRARRYILGFALLAALGFAGWTAAAQEPAPVPGDSATPAPATADAAASPAAPDETAVPDDNDGDTSAAITAGQVDPNNIEPIIFTYWERAAIQDARNSRGLVRPPTDDELTRDLKSGPGGKVKPSPEERDITLGGIVYVKPGDWTLWLNGKRVTPDAIPKEVIDLKVYKEYVEMKWFDDYTNQIFPLRLRAHERFNLDTRIFLPG